MLSFRPQCESVCVQTQFAQHSACVKCADFASVVQIFTVQKKKKIFFLFLKYKSEMLLLLIGKY